MIYACNHLFAFIALIALTVKAQQYFSNSDDYAETESELVSVEHSIHGRSLPKIVINITSRGIEREFILQSSDGFFAGRDTKIWVARNRGGKLKYTLQRNIMEKVNITFYHDVKTMSAITHTVNKDGNSEFNGVIDSNKIIRSLNNHDRKRRDVSSKLQYESANNDSKNYHLLYKRDASSPNHNNYYQTTYDRNNDYQQKKDYSINIPKIVYPEILVFVDKTVYHKKDIEKTTAYVLTIFNGADLYYRDMDEPSIRLSIAGIVLCEDPINTGTLNGSSFNEFVATDFGKFLYREKQFRITIDYDAVVYIFNPSDKRGSKGVADMASVCQVLVELEMVLSLAVITDTGNLDGIRIAAHELGHLFGADHDIIPKKVCCFKKGFVMSYNIYDQNQFFFSPCSKEYIKWYLSQEEAKCILNNPADRRSDNQILRVLPGQFMTLDEQCQKSGYTRASSVNEDICLRINCMKGIHSITVDGAALEGTPCDLGKFCLRGECVNVPFNNSDKNEDINILFPFKYQPSGMKKTAEQQCVKYDYEVPVKSFFDVCELKCVIKTDTAFYVKQYNADDGTPCKNDGICQKGQCIDDDYRFANDYCKKAGTTGFSNYSTKDCTFNCKIVTYNISDEFINLSHVEIIRIEELLAPDGHSCNNSGYCQDGKCINKKFSPDIIMDPSVDERYGEFVSSIERCKQRGMRWVLDYKDRCVTRCVDNKIKGGHYINADTGLPCTNNGFCKYGKCVNQKLKNTTTALNNSHSKFKSTIERCQELGFSWVHDYNNGCTTYCQLTDNDDIEYDQEYLDAENGSPCNNKGYCHDKICVNMTVITSSTSSATSTSSESTTSSSIDTTSFVDKIPVRSKIIRKQCEDIGLTTLKFLNDGCMALCDDKYGNTHQYFNTPERYPCVINNKTDGYCQSGYCEVQSFTTSTVSITDSTTSFNKLPSNLESPVEQCINAGYIAFHTFDRFDCTVICTNVTDLDYDYDYENEYENDETNTFQDLSRPDGIACKYNGNCSNGQCVNMSLIDPNDKSTKWDFDALKVFQNKTRRVIKHEGGGNYSKLFNNEENKKENNDSIDLSDIDDDVKEFAKDIKIFL
ncbi:uncharacterized protein LOC122503538 isoform X2 [Leptopilina heterotoma]|uniref:uncharacterized protein LOC122503538 isoform X2 n=1 Tax=Leptopilina heterotoma TaxID=63436 RepID=UPI001CA8A654|nr:uncharacterized protein LOC122503538 isoform X2 [Leptopilina heterotoma]